MTTEIDITKTRGDTKRMIFVIKDSDGNVVDISAWTSFLMSLNPDKAPTDNLGQLAQFTGSLTTDGLDGRAHFTPDGTEAIGKYFYDCQALDSNSEKITFSKGRYTIEQDITKD